MSLGCPKNLIDSERALALLVERGALICQQPQDADTIIINTCGFIESAKTEAIDAILEAAQLKQAGICKQILVGGCFSQRYLLKLPRLLPEVDAFFSLLDNREAHRLADYAFNGKTQAKAAAPETPAPLHSALRLLLTPSHYAYLRIAEGCDNRCSYCAVPDIRGPLRSKPPEEILHEARQLAEVGVRELNIVAQDTTAYGDDLGGKPGLANLLGQLCQVKGISWIRLLYAHPAHITDDLISVMAEEEEICNYIDLPIQHTSDRILRKMGRKVTSARIKEIIHKLREKIPDLAIRTSLIVGFPGEDEQDFQQLLKFVKWARFDRLGVFTYSREEGTPAYELSGQVPKRVSQCRRKALYQIQQRIVARKQADLLEKVLPVLLDLQLPDRPSLFLARSYAHAPEVDGGIYIWAPGHAPGDFVGARIAKVKDYDLIASLDE